MTRLSGARSDFMATIYKRSKRNHEPYTIQHRDHLGKRTWLLAQKDLERAGSPYETDAGVADFHAAGRHSHITELLRNGASLPEAKELARHSDIKMTIRYTHIGIADQAKSVTNLPTPAITRTAPDE